MAYRYFTTDHRSFIVADTPGHEEYTRNMAVGASFADLAVILVDASQGVLTQTRRPVSYTHLDVYKRQMYTCSVRCCNTKKMNRHSVWVLRTESEGK